MSVSVSEPGSRVLVAMSGGVPVVTSAVRALYLRVAVPYVVSLSTAGLVPGQQEQTWFAAVGTPTWTYPTRQELATRARTALRFVEAAQWVVERLPLGASVSQVSDDLNAERERLDRGLNLIQLYGVYTEVDCIFDTRNVTALWDQVPAKERQVFPFDPALYDWTHYFQDAHFPTVVRMSRAETAARKGKQPTGSTASAADTSGETTTEPDENPAVTAKPAATAAPGPRTRFGAWLGRPMTSFHLIIAVTALLTVRPS